MREADLPVLPAQPGVYLFKDAPGSVLYVGKAKLLPDRVRSYFDQASRRAIPKMGHIADEAQRLEFITTQNEVEALLLESNLIKQYRPPYNIILKDDKQYPFLAITSEPFPRLVLTRRQSKDGKRHFGPYPEAGAVRRVIKLLETVFPIHTCGEPGQHPKKHCLYYQMHRCSGPCLGAVTPEQYQALFAQVEQVIKGDIDQVRERLQEQMRRAAQDMDFEYAATLRDRLQALERIGGTRQSAIQLGTEDLDVLGVALAGEYAMVQVFFFRRGRIIGRDKRLMQGARDAPSAEALTRFLMEFYGQATSLPGLILVPEPLEDQEAPTAFLSQRAGKQVELRMPQRGDKVPLLEMAMHNAQAGLESEIALLMRRGENPALAELQQVLKLPARPVRIEGFDISNLFGEHTVASMVVFQGGRPQNSQYRRFRIRTVQGINDFASMYEVMTRRHSGSLAEKTDPPDLILIDGGKGQVGAAKKALHELGLDHLPLVGLAKREEIVILADGSELLLPRESLALRLLQAVRDEAHRFAIDYHRRLRDKGVAKSVLDDIPGIGPKRRHLILEEFASLEELYRAPLEALAKLPGVGLETARRIKEHFGGPGSGGDKPGFSIEPR
ncbi:MAG: excinuclease ABC subunit UvrC [Deinococcus sp.]|nr:excinuclease ABC subunit UvrC [Deinococcus sp.]